jgi:hypothetical protein
MQETTANLPVRAIGIDVSEIGNGSRLRAAASGARATRGAGR